MRVGFSIYIVALFAVVAMPMLTAVACGMSSTNAGPCVAGQQIACACAGGGSGVQICTAEGTYGACSCGDGGRPTESGTDGTTSEDHGGNDAASDVGEDSGPLTGAFLWANQYGTSQGTPSVVGVATDGNGNILLTGSFTGTVDFGNGNLTSAGATNIFVAKLDATGHAIWSESYGGTGDQGGNSIAVDASGNVLVVG